MKVRPQIGRPCAASLAHEQRFQIGQSDIVWPAVSDDPSPMAAMIIRAIDQQVANTHFAHFTYRDFLRTVHRSHSLPLSSSTQPHVFGRLVSSNKLFQEVRKPAVLIGTSLADLSDHVCRDVANPALRNVKADDSHGIDVLAFQHIGNHTFEVGIFDVGLAPRGTPFAIVIQNQIDVLIVARNDRWRLTHYSLHRQNTKQRICAFTNRVFWREPLPATSNFWPYSN